jgi:hypothetical protein
VKYIAYWGLFSISKRLDSDKMSFILQQMSNKCLEISERTILSVGERLCSVTSKMFSNVKLHLKFFGADPWIR